jgi:hypothetical protein
MRTTTSALISASIVALVAVVPATPAEAASCEAWVAPQGSDAGSGTAASPWRTMSHAAEAVADAGCTVWFMPGVYSGGQQIKRRFATVTTFRSATPYRAVLQHADTVLDVDGAKNVVIEGFEIRHDGPGAAGYVVIVDQGDGLWAENITLRDNMIHDSYDNDLLKIHNGVRFAFVVGNVFYNQGPSEQHMDVNSVTDVVIEGNVFFNDFAASGRTSPGDTKHFIVVKDSNEGADGLLGARRITIRRNVFSHWQGGDESLIQVGNDGKPYLEARVVNVVNNLFLGEGTDRAQSVLGIAGASDVLFANNTISGDFPTRAIALSIVQKGANPTNERIVLANNIYSDPTGSLGAKPGETSGQFSVGDPASVVGLVLDSNMYWNDGGPLPPGDVISPDDDVRALVADPGLNAEMPASIPTVWTGVSFASGAATVSAEFGRIVEGWARPGGVVAGHARPDLAPADDIFGNLRGPAPSIGAVEASPIVFGNEACPEGAVASAGFTDVFSVTAEARWAIDCIVFHGVSEGVGGSRFAPDQLVPRWQMALFLVRTLDAAGVALPDGADQGFTDLAGLSSEAVMAVNRLAQLNVAKGVDDSRFAPGQVVSRWHMALFLVRTLDAAGVALPDGADQGFTDLAGLSSEAVMAVNRLAQLEVTKGVGDSRFDPAGSVPRWQMALFLARELAVGGVRP